MGNQVPQLEIDLPWQEQVVECCSEFESFPERHGWRYETDVDIGSSSLTAQCPRAIEHNFLNMGMAADQLQ